jgi:hypothetical protein
VTIEDESSCFLDNVPDRPIAVDPLPFRRRPLVERHATGRVVAGEIRGDRRQSASGAQEDAKHEAAAAKQV